MTDGVAIPVADHDPPIEARGDYGAVLRPVWWRDVLRDVHPVDRSPVYRSAPEATSGDGDAPPLVLLHGVGNDGSIYAPIMSSLAEHTPVIAPTMSPDLLRDLGPRRTDVSAKLVDWLSALTPPPWRIVGHSMGGVLTGLILRYRPELVTGAVLLNSPLPDITRRIREGDRLDRSGRALLMLKALARFTVLGRPRLPRLLRGPELVAVRLALGGIVVDPGELDDRVVSRAVMASRTPDGIDFIRLAREIPETEWTPFDERPVSIVLGATDPLTPADDLEEVRRRYPAAAIHVLEPCSHFAHLEQPARTVEIIRDALTS